MCTVLFAWQWRPDVPLVLAANRDERLARPTDPPMRLHEHPAIWGGRDRVAGGTWLAVEPGGARVAAVTNRWGDHDAALRSRGELPVRLLVEGFDLLDRLDPTAYNPVNVLALGPHEASWSTLAGTTRIAPGIHAITVGDLDDPELLEPARAAAAEATDATDLRDRLAALLAAPGVCIHGEEYGTVSSSTVVVGPAGVELRHAPGRPCVTPYAVVPTAE